MPEPALEADYLVTGTGASAMAFVDTLLDESPRARVIMVGREARVGGHWNHAYPFVRLHQPSAFYGVASRELGSGRKDVDGPNAGMYELATGAQVLGYYDAVMRERLLPSGRVRWLPSSEVVPDAPGAYRVRELASGRVRTVDARKFVDVTLARTEVPSTHPPRYRIDPGVRCLTPNELAGLGDRPDAVTVVGGGKTGMDTCLWLLEHGMPPDRIRWIVPRDAWLLNRCNFQPGLENFEISVASVCAQFDAIAAATSLPDLFARLERHEVLLRLDPDVEPKAYKCAIVSHGELAALRRIRDVVRLGRVRAVEPTRIVLEHGTLSALAGTVYVDCTASAIQRVPPRPVFDGDRIHVLMVRWCQPVFSAAVIAWVEAHLEDPAQKNALCGVVPSPFDPVDWLRMWNVTLGNFARWRQVPALQAWLLGCRLNGTPIRDVRPDDEVRIAAFRESGAKAGAAGQRIPALLAMDVVPAGGQA
jgi:hypothetical protein